MATIHAEKKTVINAANKTLLTLATFGNSIVILDEYDTEMLCVRYKSIEL